MILKSLVSQLVGSTAVDPGDLFEVNPKKEKLIARLLKEKKAVEATDAEIKKAEAAKAKADKAKADKAEADKAE